MKKKYYLPVEEIKLAEWLQNLASKIATYATKYGLTAAQVTFIQEAAAFFNYWFGAHAQLKASTESIRKYKREILNGVPAGGSASVAPANISFTPPAAVAPGVLKVIRGIVAAIKKNPAYTTTDGEDLKIEGAESDVDLNSLKPVFTIELQAGKPNLKWKKGIAGGVKIKVNRFIGPTPPPPMPGPGDPGGDFKFLAIDTQPDYLDTTPLPPFGQSATWLYIMIYMIGDEEVGQWSDPVLVTVTGTP